MPGNVLAEQQACYALGQPFCAIADGRDIARDCAMRQRCRIAKAMYAGQPRHRVPVLLLELEYRPQVGRALKLPVFLSHAWPVPFAHEPYVRRTPDLLRA